jgi:hypothetical protein
LKVFDSSIFGTTSDLRIIHKNSLENGTKAGFLFR